MPFFWKPDSKRTQISPERMKSAVLQVVLEGKSIRSAAKNHRIDRKTLGRYVQKYKNTKDEEIELKPNYSSAQIFTDAEENLLEEYLTLAAEIHYGLTSKVARQIAYEHGIALKKTLPDNWYATKCASYDWLRGFLHRHKSFSLRNPNAVGSAGGYEYYENLKPRNKYIAQVFESERIRESKGIAVFNDSATSSSFDSKFIANVNESGVLSAYDSKLIYGSGASSVHNSKQEEEKALSESRTIHDTDCLLNTTGSSNFTPFCTCQYKSENHISIIPINNVSKPEDMLTSENHVSITPINNVANKKTINNVSKPEDIHTSENHVSITPINTVSNPEDIYILPTTDEPNGKHLASLEETISFSESRPTKSNRKRKPEKSLQLSEYRLNEETVKEPELKKSRRKRKL